MTRVLLAGTAGLLMSGAAAFAGGLAPPIQPIAPMQAYAAPATCPVVQPVITALQAQGFTRIEVDTGPTQARFAALRSNERHVFVYDCASGALLDREADRVASGFAPGVVGVGDDDDNDFVIAGSASEGDTDANGGNRGSRPGGSDGGEAGSGGEGGGDTDSDIGTGAGGETPDSGTGGGNQAGGGEPSAGGGVGSDSDPDDEADDDIGVGFDNGNAGGCDRGDTEGSENAPNDNCGGGNNTGGVDPDNPGAGGGGGRTGGVDSNGNGPGNGGLGGNG